MAVQAQYPSNAFRAQNGVLEDLSANLLRGYNRNYAGHPQLLNGTVFSDPESELTCNGSGSRKRNRDDTMPISQQPQILQQHFRFANMPKCNEKTAAAAPISPGMELSVEEIRFVESAATSTSGRHGTYGAISPSPLTQEIVSCIHQQSMEIDALIRVQNEKLRLGFEEAQKKNLRSLLLGLEHRVSKRLKEKETEIDSFRRRNAELEEKVKQMSAENQIWCRVAKNNEAIVVNLRSTIEQILLQNSSPAKEGYGDSSDGITAVADDTQSCCYEAIEERNDPEKTIRENREMKVRRTCKSCLENDVSVLLLPCRHLCLCKECESKLRFCPICKSMKNASLQIFLS